MRWLACAWLVTVGCFEPPPFHGPYDVTLTGASPSTIPVHGGTFVTVSYEGDLPPQFTVGVDLTSLAPLDVDLASKRFTFQAPLHERGDVVLSIIDVENQRAVASSEGLLSYYPAPAQPQLVVSPDEGNFDWPLHPELSTTCSRRQDMYLVNNGDEPFTITGVSSTNPLFAPMFKQSCSTLGYFDNCLLSVCFGATQPGEHYATISVMTNVGDAAASVHANVLPTTGGFDPTFHGGGVAFNRVEIWGDAGGIARPDGNGVAIWQRPNAISIDASGLETKHDVQLAYNGYLLRSMRSMRAGPPGTGIYGLIDETSFGTVGAILHFSDDVTPDAAFNKIYLPVDPALNYYHGIEVGPNGRLFVIGSLGVLAFKNGVVDTTWGSNGKVQYGTGSSGVSAIDSQGRLYVALTNRVVRFDTNGVMTTFYSGDSRALAIDSSDRVYVGLGTYAARLSATGTEEAFYTTGSPINDIAIDGSGRVYTQSNFYIQRFAENGTLDRYFQFELMTNVICPLSGHCYVIGYDRDESFNALQYSYDNFVVRLAD
jgi:hypothetical protein